MYRQRLAAAFDGVDLRVCTAFWFFGLINNVLYVVILSAALDLVGPSVPKGVVLLADVIPSFLTKLVAPYFIHVVPYSVRVLLFATLSTLGMLLIALTPAYTDGGTISTKMAGVVLASLASGGGELSFLGLTHYYGPFSLAAWGSGTGAAGLVGAGAYALATGVLKMSVGTALMSSAFLPLIMLASFFIVLPGAPMRRAVYTPLDETEVESDDEADGTSQLARSSDGLLIERIPKRPSSTSKANAWLETLRHSLRRSRGLFFPFMLPLLLVYIAEYTINQGVAPTLLFPLPLTPFTSYRQFYPLYATLYQAGVFLSRSSTPFVRIRNLYLPSLLQVANLVVLTSHALFDFLPSVWIVFAIVFWEGLLGGCVYVNTFAEILERVDDDDREFSLGATSVSDSGGVCVAGFLAMVLEVALCSYQVEHGRDYCRRL